MTKKSKSLFSVIYSTLSPQALISLLVSHYEIDIPKSCQFWHRGLSDVYLVETLNSPYILRVSHHHWRSKTELDFELELLNFLQQREIPVASPLKTRQGDLSVEIIAPEGKRYAVLFPYAPGEVPLGDFNPTQSHLFGEILARVHQVAREFQPPVYRQPLTPEYLLDESLQAIAEFLHSRSQDLKFILDVAGQIKEQLRKLPTQSPHWGICWGDPHSGNVHFTPDNRMTLFDFDQCGYGWRGFDLGKFLQVALQTGLSRGVRDAFLNGYQTLEPLSEQELNSLQSFTQMAYIWSWAISVNTAKLWDYSRLDNYYFTQRIEKLKRLTAKDWLF